MIVIKEFMLQTILDVIEWCDYIKHKDVKEHCRIKLNTVNLRIGNTVISQGEFIKKKYFLSSLTIQYL